MAFAGAPRVRAAGGSGTAAAAFDGAVTLNFGSSTAADAADAATVR
jgi:hypothetical protein